MDFPILLSCGTLYLHNASDNFPVQGLNIQAVLVMLCIQLQANPKVPLEPLSMRSPDACACFPGLPGEGHKRYPARQLSIVTSLSKVCTASFNPSTVVR